MMMQRILLPILLAAALAGCGEAKKPAETPAPATPVPADTVAVPAEPQVMRRPEITFEDQIHEEYSYEGINIPRRVSDSILQANKSDPRKMEREMTAYFQRRDSAVRQGIADRHGITLDSLNRILKEKDSEKK